MTRKHKAKTKAKTKAKVKAELKQIKPIDEISRTTEGLQILRDDAIQGVTETGFKYTINNDVMDNMEILDCLGEIDTDPTAISKMLTLVLGDEQKKALYEHCRGENGVVSARQVASNLGQILTGAGTLKK